MNINIKCEKDQSRKDMIQNVIETILLNIKIRDNADNYMIYLSSIYMDDL